jgi:hypothetical protein
MFFGLGIISQDNLVRVFEKIQATSIKKKNKTVIQLKRKNGYSLTRSGIRTVWKSKTMF